MTRDLPIAIVGAGAAGMAVADALRTAGFSNVRVVDKELLALAQTATEVTLAFTDGTTDEAGLVVGAGEARSTVRDIIFGWGSVVQGLVDGRIALVDDIAQAGSLAQALEAARNDDVEAALKEYERRVGEAHRDQM